MESADEVRTLLRRWHVDGHRAARAELVERMLPLARSLARRYAGKGEPLEDLEQVASLGLLKAIDRFDVSRDVRFATFAVPTIAGELKRHFRDRGWMLRVPRDVQELSARVSRARETLTRELDGLGAREREILRLRYYEGLTQREIARAVGVSQMHVSRLIRRSIDTMRDSIETVASAA